MANETLLQLKDVSVSYGGVKALDRVDIALDEGEVVGLVGPNGAGKSTVLKSIFGLTPIEKGSVLWHEEPMRPKPHQVVSKGIVFVPQGRRVFTHLTVDENLDMGGFVVHDKKELARRKEEAMSFFPVLKRKRKARSGALSGGEQQMLALARGLMADPKVLLLDEPSLGLAPKIAKEVFQKIREINERHKTAVMIVEHNIRSLLEIVSRVYVLDKGEVLFSGAPDELESNALVRNVFLEDS